MKCTKHTYATIYFREAMSGTCPLCKLRAAHDKLLGERAILKGEVRPLAMQGATIDNSEEDGGKINDL